MLNERQKVQRWGQFIVLEAVQEEKDRELVIDRFLQRTVREGHLEDESEKFAPLGVRLVALLCFELLVGFQCAGVLLIHAYSEVPVREIIVRLSISRDKA